ncbi:hypothetical protein RhiirC2_797000 [Rhizophagus irregularis]|uniref:Uncharacterized protein n=1 Tax=Rhizophagus irregularis TaxID=588596 RepID=A0A2N1M8Q3_9GLOM|nr:hypothetical protein RhiirC2_797000 [Rhizophagus irregularis]
MLTSEQIEQDLSQSYITSSENIREKYDKKKKTATSMVYQKIKQLLFEITDVNLHQKIFRTRKLYKLFNILELEKIKQVSYITDAILSLNY